MKRRIASVVTLIAFLTTFVLSMPVGIASAAPADEVVFSPDNMLDVSVVDKDGNPINGIDMALVDSSGVEVATWKTGRTSVDSIEGSYIKGISSSGYPVYLWRFYEEASKLVGNDPIKRIIKPLGEGVYQTLYKEGDSLSGYYTYSGSTSNNCVIQYFEDYDTALTVQGGKVVTVIDESLTKGSVRLGDTTWQIAGNQGIKTFDMAPGEYLFNLNRTATISNETTKYVKIRLKLSELSSFFNADGTYNHSTLGAVAFPADDPNITSVLSFCSGSVITVPKPDSEGYVEIYVEDTEREALLNTDFVWTASSGNGTGGAGGGCSFGKVFYDEKEFTAKGKTLSPTGTLLLYVPAGNYTVKMSNVPAGYEPKEPVAVTVTDSSAIQPLSIELADAHVHSYGTEYKYDATNHWNECACGDKANVTAHTPGPEATETSPQVCTICGYEIAPIK